MFLKFSQVEAGLTPDIRGVPKVGDKCVTDNVGHRLGERCSFTHPGARLHRGGRHRSSHVEGTGRPRQPVEPVQVQIPIVLVHGFIGFDNILGIRYLDQIKTALKDDGASVCIAAVNPSQTTDFRGEELIQQKKQWAAKDGVMPPVARRDP